MEPMVDYGFTHGSNGFKKGAYYFQTLRKKLVYLINFLYFVFYFNIIVLKLIQSIT